MAFVGRAAITLLDRSLKVNKNNIMFKSENIDQVYTLVHLTYKNVTPVKLDS